MISFKTLPFLSFFFVSLSLDLCCSVADDVTNNDAHLPPSIFQSLSSSLM